MVASLEVKVIESAESSEVSPSVTVDEVIAIVGAEVSTAVKLTLAAFIALSAASSTEVPIAT